MGPTCLPCLNTCEVTGDMAPGPSHPVSASPQTCGKACFTEMTLPSFHLAFPGSSDSRESACNPRDPGSIPVLGGFPWRRKWQPTPVFLPGKSHGQRSLAGYSPWGRKESDTTERLHSLYYRNLLVLSSKFRQVCKHHCTFDAYPLTLHFGNNVMKLKATFVQKLKFFI